MNETMKHTPTPWSVKPTSLWTDTPWRIEGADGFSACLVYGDGALNKGTTVANAAHIVKCVNAHDALVQRLQELVNICTHPNAKKSDMRMIAAEARSFLFDLDVDKPDHA